MSAHTWLDVSVEKARENTPEAKLQKLHFVRQNGTEM